MQIIMSKIVSINLNKNDFKSLIKVTFNLICLYIFYGCAVLYNICLNDSAKINIIFVFSTLISLLVRKDQKLLESLKMKSNNKNCNKNLSIKKI